jgi:hypothetical protein
VRTQLADILEKFRPSLESYTEFSQVDVELVLSLITDAYKSGYMFGLASATETVVGELDSYRGNIALVSGLLKNLDNPITLGAWQACDTLQDNIKFAIATIVKDDLH